MEFTWDEAKRVSNIVKHGIDLIRGEELFDGRVVLTLDSPRGDEQRSLTIGQLDGRFVALVWLQRSDNIRLISLRIARDAEKRKYRASLG